MPLRVKARTENFVNVDPVLLNSSGGMLAKWICFPSDEPSVFGFPIAHWRKVALESGAYTQNRSAMIDVATATLRMVGVSQHRAPQTLTAGCPTRCPLGRAA